MAEPAVPGSACAAAALASELRRLRRTQGLSQRELARALGYSAHSAISDFEAGRRLPANDVLVAYERLLSLPAGTLRDLRRRVLAERAAEPDGQSASSGASGPAADPGAAAGDAPARAGAAGDVPGSAGPGSRPAAPAPGLPAAPAPGAPGPGLAGVAGHGARRAAGRLLRWPARPLLASAVALGVLLAGGVAGWAGDHGGTRWLDPTWGSSTQHVSDTSERKAAPEDMDGDDPRARDCVFDATVRETVPLYLPGGERFGVLRLRHSARCGASWGSALYSDPELYVVQITATRPADGAEVRSQWGNNTPPGSYGDMLSTARGCVQVTAVVITPSGTGPAARTRCLR